MKNPCDDRPLRRLPVRLVPVVVAAGSMAHAATVPVGVNFSIGNDLAPGDSAGAPGYAQSNWNNLAAEGGPVALNDGNGTATTIQIKWGSNNGWADGSNNGSTPDKKLMKGYLDSNGQSHGAFDGFGSNDDEPLILLTGLDDWMTANGFRAYSIVVYTDGDSSDGTRGTRVWLAATGGTAGADPGLGGDLTPRVDVVDAANFGTSETYTEVPAARGANAQGNYTVFKLQTAASVYLRTEEAGTAPFRAPINAIQVIGTDEIPADTDGDALPDAWEITWGLDPGDDGSGDPKNGASGDPDGDGLENIDEYGGGILSSNPADPDSDGDGLGDGVEWDLGTNLLHPDMDDDGLPDGWEVRYGLDPKDDGSADERNGPDGDIEADGLFNLDEYLGGTDPSSPDTDGDGYTDLAEDRYGSWAGVDATGTDPRHADTDGDGLKDGDENPDLPHHPGGVSGTDPNKEDTDGDGVTDRWEILLGLDPTVNSPEESLPVVPLTNGSFEAPATSTFSYVDPPGWLLENLPNNFQSFTENSVSVGLRGGDGLNFFGTQAVGGRISQDTGVPFLPDTTYIVDVQGGYRPMLRIDGAESPAKLEFGLCSSDDDGNRLGVDPGFLDERSIHSVAGNPDADNRFFLFRSASSMAGIGEGSLGRAYSFVTGNTPPSGNVVVYLEQVSAGRVNFDHVRIFAVPNSLDRDADGLPDVWELANRLDPSIGEGADGAAGDPDGDGASNREELEAGTDPMDAASVPSTASAPRVVSAAFNGGTFEIAVENLPERSYQLMRAPDLAAFSSLGAPVSGVSSRTFTDPSRFRTARSTGSRRWNRREPIAGGRKARRALCKGARFCFLSRGFQRDTLKR